MPPQAAAGVLTGQVETPLFGGALTCTLPRGWLDCSDARPVPDHQEVWLERDGKCRSLIIEILERADEEDGKCAVYHFFDIAEANDAMSQHVAYTNELPTSQMRPSIAKQAGPAYVLHGLQVLPPEGASNRLGREQQPAGVTSAAGASQPDAAAAKGASKPADNPASTPPAASGAAAMEVCLLYTSPSPRDS